MSDFSDQSRLNLNRKLLLSNPKFEELNSGKCLNLLEKTQVQSKKPNGLFNAITEFFKSETDIEKEEIELILGLDFGTSSTKIIIRDLDLNSSTPVEFNEKSNPFLVSTSLMLNHDGSFFIDSVSIAKSLKVDFMKLNSLEDDRELSCKVVSFLATVLRHSRSWFLKRNNEIYIDHNIFWRVNMGAPVGLLEVEKKSEIYRKALSKAWQLSMKTYTEINSYELVQNFLFSEETDQTNQSDVVHLMISPEIAALSLGYVKSRKLDPLKPVLLLIDVGSSTLDTCIIHIDDSSRTFSFWAAIISNKGAGYLHQTRVKGLVHDIESSSLSRNLQGLLEELTLEVNLGFLFSEIPEKVTEYIDLSSLSEDSKAIKNEDDFSKAVSNQLNREIIFNADGVPSVGTKGMLAILEKVAPLNIQDYQDKIETILCGGGSNCRFYRKIIEGFSQPTLHLNEVGIPSDLKIQRSEENPMLLMNVSYGLSYGEDWKVNYSNQLSDIQVKISDWQDHFKEHLGK